MIQCCKFSHFSLKQQENFDQFTWLAVLCNQYSYAVFMQCFIFFTINNRLTEIFYSVFGGVWVYLQSEKRVRGAEKGLFSPIVVRRWLRFLIFDFVFYFLPRFYPFLLKVWFFFTRLQDSAGRVAGLSLTSPATGQIFFRTCRCRMQEKLVKKEGQTCQNLPLQAANSGFLLKLRKICISVFRYAKRCVC